MKFKFKNKKKIFYFLLFIIFITTCSYAAFSIFSLNNIRTQSKNIEEREEFNYLIKEVEGKINVFKVGCKKPISILEKEIEYLPEYDQKMLKNGIYVENSEKLNKILEDYSD